MVRCFFSRFLPGPDRSTQSRSCSQFPTPAGAPFVQRVDCIKVGPLGSRHHPAHHRVARTGPFDCFGHMFSGTRRSFLATALPCCAGAGRGPKRPMCQPVTAPGKLAKCALISVGNASCRQKRRTWHTCVGV